jgi:hypothetical protein
MNRQFRPRARKGLQTRSHPTGHLTRLVLRDRLMDIREDPLGDHLHHHHHHLLLRRLQTLHQLRHQESPQFPSHQSYQRPHIKRSPTSRRQRTSLRQRSGIVSDDRPSSTSRKIDETSIMTKRSFDSC